MIRDEHNGWIALGVIAMLLALLAFVAIAFGAEPPRLQVFDSRTGLRVGTVVETGAGVFGLFGRDGERLGWGRRESSGRVELFDRDGRRVGTAQPETGILWVTPGKK